MAPFLNGYLEDDGDYIETGSIGLKMMTTFAIEKRKFEYTKGEREREREKDR